jgi:hypothetical protein
MTKRDMRAVLGTQQAALLAEITNCLVWLSQRWEIERTVVETMLRVQWANPRPPDLGILRVNLLELIKKELS